MKISSILLYIYNLVCLNYFLINCDLNNLLKQFACWVFDKPHTLYFPALGTWAEHCECGMGIERHVCTV
jgi:hypothetical protein